MYRCISGIIFLACYCAAQTSGGVSCGSCIIGGGYIPLSPTITTTPTQAILSYTPAIGATYTLQVADMQRGITISSATQSSGTVTVTTTTAHGLLTGAVVYLENTGISAWNGWQTLTGAPAFNQFTFANATSGTASAGNVGVLVDDVNPNLFSGANLDSRAGNIQTDANGKRDFIVGERIGQVASDANRYVRALQTDARHIFTLAGAGQTVTGTFTTSNIPLGGTYNDGPPVDRRHPGQYAYSNIQWGNQAQFLIDPTNGIGMRRATSPNPTSSGTKSFVTSINPSGAWTDNGILTSSNATFTGPCSLGASSLCPLFLRADNLSILQSYTLDVTSTGKSLDWLQVAITGSMSGTCSGDDCKMQACWTVNGVSCASGTLDSSALTSTPTALTFGTQTVGNLWQSNNQLPFSSVDTTAYSGNVTYNASTQQVSLSSGYGFNTNWTAGSCFTMGGTEYTIASVQSERTITLAPTNTCGVASLPGSNLGSTAASAGNAGVLLWKKTNSVNTLTLSSPSYLYGASTVQTWPAGETNACSDATVTVGGVAGNNCFFGSDLHWVSNTGTDVDLGAPVYYYYSPTFFSAGLSSVPALVPGFDIQNGDCWYSMPTAHYAAGSHIVAVQVCYEGAHTGVQPNSHIVDCATNGGVHPCLQYTVMTPPPYAIDQVLPTFNSDSVAANFWTNSSANGGWNGFYEYAGASDDGVLVFYAWGNQDSPGWVFIFNLGDRTPTGTDAGSAAFSASASSYRQPIASYGNLHFISVPQSGWEVTASQDATTYTMTMTATLSSSVSACPSNPLGVPTGTVDCSTITVTAQPSNGTVSLANVAVGQVLQINTEYLRVLAMNSALQFVVQRGYLSTSVVSHAGTTLEEIFGAKNQHGGGLEFWNYATDPTGANASWNTILSDPGDQGGHWYTGGGVNIQVGYVARLGNFSNIIGAPQVSISNNPNFAGLPGFQGGSSGTGIDSHPGGCQQSTVCADGRPVLALDGSDSAIVGSSGTPFTNVTGFLWKYAGAGSILHPKVLNTMAYVGRHGLVNISGPSSVIDGTSAHNYEYCLAVIAGECYSGSSVGDLYVNAPYVSYPYCYGPASLGDTGGAAQPDDYNSICIGDMAGHIGNLVEFGVTADASQPGQYSRNLGSGYNHWNQMIDYWTGETTPALTSLTEYSRWMDGARTDYMSLILPPMPSADSVNRSTFIPLTETLTAPTGLGVATAAIEFGYEENGGQFYCTSRQENCAAVASTVNASIPFYWESETYSNATCPTTCTIAIPGISGRVLYWREKLYNSGGSLVFTGPTQAITVQ